MTSTKSQLRERRKGRIRAKINGSSERPRLVVFRSLNHIYAQLVNDESGKVIASASDMKAKGKGTKTDRAKAVGEEIASKAKEHKINLVVFDRNGFKYHGRVKAVAEAAREGGLQF